LEVKGNLELFKDDALTAKSPADPGFLTFINRLQTRLDNIYNRLRKIIATLAEVQSVKELYPGED
jgi:hypothetical protein